MASISNSGSQSGDDVIGTAFSYVIYPAIDKIFPLTALRKIAIGLFVMVPGFAIVAMLQSWIDAGETPNISWQLFAYAVLTASEVMVSITCLEFAYTQAPTSMKSVVMAVFLFSVSLGNYFTAGVNKFILVEKGDIASVTEVTKEHFGKQKGWSESISMATTKPYLELKQA